MPQPGNPQALNRYAYVLNNPLRYTDPSGHFPFDLILDVIGVGFDVYMLWTEPSWENTGWLAVDLVLWAVPYVPAAAGPVAKGAKFSLSHGDEVAKLARAASHADDLSDAVGVAKRLAGVGRHSDEAAGFVKKLAELSTRGELTKGGTVSLGHFKAVGDAPGYIEWAKKAGAAYFDMDSAAYDVLKGADGEAIWAINRQFLDNAVEAGARFHLQTPNAKPGSYFAQEIEYLIGLGYQLVQEGGEWWLIRP